MAPVGVKMGFNKSVRALAASSAPGNHKNGVLARRLPMDADRHRRGGNEILDHPIPYLSPYAHFNFLRRTNSPALGRWEHKASENSPCLPRLAV